MLLARSQQQALARDTLWWTPADLGASLLAWWDAEQAATITLAGALVTTWTDAKNGYAPTQSTSGFKPIYSATSLNNRPGITFDATDDSLALAPVPAALPIGANPCEIWSLVNQTLPGATSAERALISWGGGTNNTTRRARRAISGASNRFGARVGSGAASVGTAAGDFSGIHTGRCVFTATTVSSAMDSIVADETQAIVPNTSNTRISIGATEATSPGGFFGGVMNTNIITSILDDTQATKLLRFLKFRGGIP